MLYDCLAGARGAIAALTSAGTNAPKGGDMSEMFVRAQNYLDSAQLEIERMRKNLSELRGELATLLASAKSKRP